MINLELLKIRKAVSEKSGKEYNQVHVIIGTEIIRAFIWDNQYDNILNQLDENQKRFIVEDYRNKVGK